MNICVFFMNKASVAAFFLAYYLITNHVFLISVPDREAYAIVKAHRLYRQGMNFREAVEVSFRGQPGSQ